MDFNKIIDFLKDTFSNFIETIKRVNWEKFKIEYNPDNQYQNYAVLAIISIICLICFKIGMGLLKSKQVGAGLVVLIISGVFGVYIYNFFKTNFMK